jgi:hypothetical protein
MTLKPLPVDEIPTRTNHPAGEIRFASNHITYLQSAMLIFSFARTLGDNFHALELIFSFTSNHITYLQAATLIFSFA